VSELESPEPMIRILGAINSLESGEYILMLHRMTPTPLFRLIEKEGCCYKNIELEDGSVRIYIWLKSDTQLGEFIKDKCV